MLPTELLLVSSTVRKDMVTSSQAALALTRPVLSTSSSSYIYIAVAAGSSAQHVYLPAHVAKWALIRILRREKGKLSLFVVK